MQRLREKYLKLHKTNIIISYLVLLFSLYLIFFPFFPEVTYRIAHAFGSVEHYTAEVGNTIPDALTAPLADGTPWLYIPAIGVSKKIVEATTINTVHENIWRRPQGSTPDKGSNTVFAAHRYATIGGVHGSAFYNLPKLGAGDVIYVAWEGKVYVYTVTGTKIVLPTQIEIEAPTTDSIITMYSCWPLWTADKRFVVVAALMNTLTP